jgi:hypothetical protein
MVSDGRHRIKQAIVSRDIGRGSTLLPHTSTTMRWLE